MKKNDQESASENIICPKEDLRSVPTERRIFPDYDKDTWYRTLTKTMMIPEEEVNDNDILMRNKLPSFDIFCKLMELTPKTIRLLKSEKGYSVSHLLNSNLYLFWNYGEEEIQICDIDKTRIRQWVKRRRDRVVELGEPSLIEIENKLCKKELPELSELCKVLKFTKYTMDMFIQRNLSTGMLSEVDYIMKTLEEQGFDPVVYQRIIDWGRHRLFLHPEL